MKKFQLLEKRQLLATVFLSFLGLAAFSFYFGGRMGSNSIWSRKPECLTLAITKIYNTYDPSELVTTDHVFVVDNLFGKLLYVGDNNAIYSGIAESWEISDDKKTYTLHLNSKAKFSNGTPITVDDVIASYKRHLILPGTHIELRDKVLGADKVKSINDNIQGLQKIDDSTLAIALNVPDDKFLYWLAFPELVVLPRSEAKMPLNRLSLGVTSGAYYLSEKNRDFLLLKENPYFYTERGSAGKCLRVLGIEDPEEAISRFKKKEIDVMDYGAAFSPNFSYFYDNIDYAVVSAEPRALVYFAFNPRRQLVKDSSSRRAISNQIRSDQLIPYAPNRAFKSTNQFLVESHEGFLNPDEIRDALAEYKPTKVAKMEISVLYPKVFGEPYRDLLKQQLEQQLGSRVQVIEYSEGDVLRALEKNNWDMFFFLVGMGEKATNILFGYHFKGKNPMYPWNDAVISDSMDKMEKASDSNERLGYYKAISKRLISEAYIKPCFTFTWPILMRSDLEFKQFNQFKFNNDLWYLSWKN